MKLRFISLILALSLLLVALCGCGSSNTSSPKQEVALEREVAHIGPYSQMLRAGDFLYASAQIAYDPVTGKVVQGGISEQVKQIFLNYADELEQAGASLEDLVKVMVYLTDMSLFTEMNEAYAQVVPEPYPVRTCVEVSGLPDPEALVSISVEIYAPEKSN